MKQSTIKKQKLLPDGQFLIKIKKRKRLRDLHNIDQCFQMILLKFVMEQQLKDGKMELFK